MYLIIEICIYIYGYISFVFHVDLADCPVRSRVTGRGSRVAVRGSAAGLVLSWVEVGRRRETEEEGRVLGGFLSPSHHQSREKKSASTGVSGGVV